MTGSILPRCHTEQHGHHKKSWEKSCCCGFCCPPHPTRSTSQGVSTFGLFECIFSPFQDGDDYNVPLKPHSCSQALVLECLYLDISIWIWCEQWWSICKICKQTERPIHTCWQHDTEASELCCVPFWWRCLVLWSRQIHVCFWETMLASTWTISPANLGPSHYKTSRTVHLRTISSDCCVRHSKQWLFTIHSIWFIQSVA